jgi:restriction system protein
MTWILKAIGLLIFFAILKASGELNGFMIVLGITLGIVILFKIIVSLPHPSEKQLPDSILEAESDTQEREHGLSAEIGSPRWVNYYELLGLGPTSSVERVKNRCLELGQLCRPDLYEGDEAKRSQFDQIERALETLADPVKRARYDKIFQAVQARATAIRKLDSLIRRHSEDLLRKRRQLIVDKGYGIEDRSSWDAEIDFFFNEVAKRELGKGAGQIDLDIRSHTDRQLDTIMQSKVLPPIDELKTGIDFEHQCAKVLEMAGWKVSTTKASGDQGADIVAKKGRVSAVLQCKLYSKPVGNSAVQEAYAAKSHYGTKFAGVVTNSSYTKSAIALAASTEVALLHFEDLPNLHGILKAN